MFFFSNTKDAPLLGGKDNEDKWPSLYDEAREMLEASILIYVFADVRRLCKLGKLSDGNAEKIDRMMSLPIEASEVLQTFNENEDALKKEFGGESVEFYLTAMESIKENLREQGVDASTGEVTLQTSKVIDFDDENEQKELVYGIAVNSARRRITVAFRGSVTTTDFLTDANAIQVQIANPLKENDKRQPSMIGIHAGFKDYLFGSRRMANQEGGLPKVDKIMEKVAELMQEYPGYKLYVTGHSLGGALATLFAFQAAASSDPRIQKPVTCVSVASPKVGNLSFRKAFQGLEDKGWIRCLRVANHKDLVTLLPDRGNFSCAYIACCQSYVFRHVGIQLKLYKDRGHKLTRPSKKSGYCTLLARDWAKQVSGSLYMILMLPFVCCGREDFLKHHSCMEYMRRLSQCRIPLSRMEVNQLYQNPSSLKPSEE